jgi:hypothetical protein
VDTIELMQHSLAFSFEILEHLVSDLTQEQAEWLPPGKASPIGSLYWHAVAYSDQLVHEWCMRPYKDITQKEWLEAKSAKRELRMGQEPLRLNAGWQAKVVIASPPENAADPYWDLRAAREGLRVDLPALHGYARATAQAIQSWVPSLTLEDLEHTIPTPIGDYSLERFLASFVIWHIDVHCGEISALKGCQGLKGYPW